MTKSTILKKRKGVTKHQISSGKEHQWRWQLLTQPTPADTGFSKSD